jgi:hypothetical protein
VVERETPRPCSSLKMETRLLGWSFLVWVLLLFSLQQPGSLGEQLLVKCLGRGFPGLVFLFLLFVNQMELRKQMLWGLVGVSLYLWALTPLLSC